MAAVRWATAKAHDRASSNPIPTSAASAPCGHSSLVRRVGRVAFAKRPALGPRPPSASRRRCRIAIVLAQDEDLLAIDDHEARYAASRLPEIPARRVHHVDQALVAGIREMSCQMCRLRQPIGRSTTRPSPASRPRERPSCPARGATGRAGARRGSSACRCAPLPGRPGCAPRTRRRTFDTAAGAPARGGAKAICAAAAGSPPPRP